MVLRKKDITGAAAKTAYEQLKTLAESKGFTIQKRFVEPKTDRTDELEV
jgi:hypothetical protein